MKKALKWVGIIVLVIIVLAVLAGGSNQSKKVGQNNETSPQINNDQTSKTYKIGDKIQLGKIILTVNNAEISQGGAYSKPQEGNQWVNLNMTIENTGSTQEYVTTLGQMFILDDKNNQYQVTVTDKRLENAGSTGLDGWI
jgi:hypothetical protein